MKQAPAPVIMASSGEFPNIAWQWAMITFIGALCGCGGGGGSGGGIGGGAPAGSTPQPPVVQSTTPAANALGVSPSQVVTATMSNSMNPTTLDSTSFSLTEAGGFPVAGSVECLGPVITFTPATGLRRQTVYTARITTAALDIQGLGLVADYTWTFTVRDWAWGTALLLEADNTDDAVNQQVAVDPDGNAIAVWQQTTGVGSHIWAAHFVQGTGWVAPVQIDSSTSYYVAMPVVAFDDDGNALAVWQQFDGVRYNAWANRFIPGSGWGGPVLIETDDLGGVFRPQLVVDSAGNGVAVWSQSDGTRDSIWSNRYTVGSGWGTSELLESSDIHCGPPRLAGNASGSALAVWAQGDGSAATIFANRYAPGIGWTGTEPAEATANNCQEPDVSLDAAGNALAVWAEEYGGTWHVNANRYVAGDGWQTSLQINSGTSTAGNQRIAGDPSGNAMVVWRQFASSSFYIHACQYVVGSGWTAPTAIEPTFGSTGSSFPSVAVDANGNACAVWERHNGVRTNIESNRFNVGVGWGARELIETNDDGGAVNARVARNAGGHTFAVWAQSNGSRYNSWSNLLD